MNRRYDNPMIGRTNNECIDLLKQNFIDGKYNNLSKSNYGSFLYKIEIFGHNLYMTPWSININNLVISASYHNSVFYLERNDETYTNAERELLEKLKTESEPNYFLFHSLKLYGTNSNLIELTFMSFAGYQIKKILINDNACELNVSDQYFSKPNDSELYNSVKAVVDMIIKSHRDIVNNNDHGFLSIKY